MLIITGAELWGALRTATLCSSLSISGRGAAIVGARERGWGIAVKTTELIAREDKITALAVNSECLSGHPTSTCSLWSLDLLPLQVVEVLCVLWRMQESVNRKNDLQTLLFHTNS